MIPDLTKKALTSVVETYESHVFSVYIFSVLYNYYQ